MRRFEFSDATSNKFWEVGQDGSDVTVCFGKIGTAGKSQSKSHADPATAGVAMDKLIREKTGKGYIETSAGASAAVTAPAAAKPAKAAASAPASQAAATAAPAVVVAPAQAPAPPAGDLAPWLTVDPLIDMPAALMALALPSRRVPGSPPNADADACWNLFLTHARKCAPLDISLSAEAWREPVGEAAARIEQGLRTGSAASDVVLLALSTTFDDQLTAADGAPFLDFLAADKGLPHALQTLLDMEKVSVLQQGLRKPAIFIKDNAEEWFSGVDSVFCHTELALRRHLAHAPLGVWDACVQTIRDAVPDLPWRRQPLFGVLLPDVPDLSDTLVAGAGPHYHDVVAWLRLTVREPASMLALDSVHGCVEYYRYLFYDKPAIVATAVQDRGVDAVTALRDGITLDITADAIACIGTPEAIRELALACNASKKAIPRLTAAARRWPWAAIASLCELLGNDKHAPGAARSVLAALVPDHLAALPTLRPWMSAPALKVLDGFAGRFCAPADLADAADLPPVLANPPWMAPPKAGLKALTLAPLPLEPVERWTPDERQRVLKERRYNPYSYSGTMTAIPSLATAIATGNVDAVVALWEAHHKSGNGISNAVHVITKLPAPFNKAVWTAMGKYYINSPGYAIGTMGLDAVPGLAAMCERRPAEELCYAMYFGAVELAAPVARAYAVLKAKAARDMARRWLLANPEYAACGLIAPALGKAGAARDVAAAALRLLAGSGHEALLIEVASRYGQDAVSAAMRAMLDEDPLDRYPFKIGSLPTFWMPRGWARPRLASNGKALPDDAIDLIGVMLRFPQADGVYAGLAQVRQACTPASLGEFAWDLFNAWTDAGGESKENWAFAALRLFGNDDTARKLTPLVRAWPGESQNARAILGLDILAGIGTDTALMLLNGIAQKVKFKALQDNAREKISQIAEARNLTTEELEDRLAPDLGLDEQGSLLLDFGARRFKVGFDEALKPYVRDADGARLADLPKPNKSDDPGLSAAAVERYKLLKKDARTIAAQQVVRLEVAMCSQRRWEPEVFARFLAGHPLVRHLVQRLVWGAYEAESGYGGRLLGCFRVGADGALTSADDDAFSLPQGDNIRIGIPHALDLPASDATAFGQLFADYELLQPFAQIGRDTYTLTSEELAAKALLRWDGVVVPSGRVLGLANKGWRRGPPQDGGSIWDFNKALGADRLVELRLEPGLIVGLLDEYPEQTLKEVTVGRASEWGGIDKPHALSTLDPIAASELIRDLENLRN